MENFSEYLPIIWGLLIFGIMIFRAVAPKPKVQQPEDGEQQEYRADDLDQDDPSSQDPYRAKSIEEILGSLAQGEQKRDKSRTQAKQRAAASPKIGSRVEPQRRVAPISGDLSGDEIGDKISLSEGGEHSEVDLKFDLRQAVIMSEILTRKYDE